MKWFVVLLILLMLVPTVAIADYTWELRFDDSGIFDWSYYTDVSWVFGQKLTTVGYYQSGVFGVQTAWRSLDGGTSFTKTQYRQGVSICNMINGFSIIQSVDYLNLVQGLFVGGSIMPGCTTLLPFPECLACLLYYTPTVWISSNDAETITEIEDDPFALYETFLKVEATDTTHAWACGTGDSMLYSFWNEDEQEWAWRTPFTPEATPAADYLDLHFFDPDTGYVAVAMDGLDREQIERKLAFPESDQEAYTRFVEGESEVMWYKRPAVRLLMSRYGIKGKDPAHGHLAWTESGGSGWSNSFSVLQAAVTQVSFSTERYGVLATTEIDNEDGAQFKIYYTTSSGLGWTEAQLPECGPNVCGKYDIGDVTMVSSALGFIGGAEDDGTSHMAGYLLVTHDGGKTWAADEFQPMYPINSFDLKSRTMGYAVGEYRITIRMEGTNSRPVAVAGPDQTVWIQDEVTLDGIDSHDDDDLELTYQWTQLSGPAVTLDFPDRFRCHFTPTLGSVYKFKLDVSDGTLTGSDQVIITVLDGTDDDDDITPDDDDDTSDDDDDNDDDVVDDDDDDSVDDDDNDTGGDMFDDDDENEDDWGPEVKEEGSGCCG